MEFVPLECKDLDGSIHKIAQSLNDKFQGVVGIHNNNNQPKEWPTCPTWFLKEAR